VLEIASAREHWRVLATELKERALLSPGNSHAMQRLVLAYVIYDRASREVAENGAVIKPKKGQSRAIARVSPYFHVMRESSVDAANLEAEFGIAPRRRTAAAPAPVKKTNVKASDTYLKRVK
jgi:P27 family predicted phage terminase small subunit